jgi:hypothetical protein
MTIAAGTRGLVALTIIVALAGLWVWQCTGPDPVISNVRLEEPGQPGDPYTVLAQLDNDRWSHGTVTVNFEVVDKNNGDVYREQKNIQIEEGDDALNVSAEISAPDGEYEPGVEADYPPN